MARKADIRICRFADCTHTGKLIDISADDYIADGRSYYHKECFEAKEQKIIDERLSKEKEITDKRLEKRKVKKCSYHNCSHSSKIIDTICDEYKIRDSRYYHADCLKKYDENIDEEEKLKADIQLIKNMWVENISETVVLSQLYLELNKLIRERGISSEYVIFVMDYVIKNKCKLRYPGGLKYYVDNQDIKDAFAKKEAQKKIANATFAVDVSSDDNSPKFSVNKRPSGFSSILSRRK